MYTKHQKLPQTSKHYKESSLHLSVRVIVGVTFGVSASVASSLCGVLSFRGFILVGRERFRMGGGSGASSSCEGASSSASASHSASSASVTSSLWGCECVHVGEVYYGIFDGAVIY